MTTLDTLPASPGGMLPPGALNCASVPPPACFMPVHQRLRQILLLGLPIIGGMLSQSLLNLIDSAMVGHLGETALAGVGLGSYASFMAIALVMGLGSGVQTLVARRYGEQRAGQAILSSTAACCWRC